MVIQRSSSLIRSLIGVTFMFLLFIGCSCTDRASVDEKKAGTELSGERIIRVVFRLPGDDIGAPESKTVLNRIITSIRSLDAGEIVSSGFGMGSMEVTVKVKGEEEITKIKGIITDAYPEADYRITDPLPRL